MTSILMSREVVSSVLGFLGKDIALQAEHVRADISESRVGLSKLLRLVDPDCMRKSFRVVLCWI